MIWWLPACTSPAVPVAAVDAPTPPAPITERSAPTQGGVHRITDGGTELLEAVDVVVGKVEGGEGTFVFPAVLPHEVGVIDETRGLWLTGPAAAQPIVPLVPHGDLTLEDGRTLLSWVVLGAELVDGTPAPVAGPPTVEEQVTGGRWVRAPGVRGRYAVVAGTRAWLFDLGEPTKALGGIQR